ncbi:MAG: DUF4367 domain-containing protein [Acutalibacteraceae bacterium]
MENIKKNIHIKLNRLIDSELEKENPDAELIGECVDGILRLMPESSYQLTAEQRKNNILRILNDKTDRRFRSKFGRILLVAAIIAALLLGSVFAYTIIEYEIHDYDTYSTVWANILTKWIDEPVTTDYIPEGYELIDSEQGKRTSSKTYYNGEFYVTINKDSTKKVYINTEYGAAHTRIFNGIEYILYGEDIHGRGVLWYDGGYCYSVISFIGEEEMFEIAKHVR